MSWTGIYSEEQIVQHHTFFPIFKPFLSEGRRNKIKAILLGDQRKDVHALVGYQELRFGKGKVLWFCPLCSREDREKSGVRYWRRLHQISEVLICPVHNVMLEMAPITDQNKPFDRISFFQDAENSIPIARPRIYEGSISRYFTMIAEDYSWLLAAPHEAWNREDIGTAYQKLLLELSSATHYSRAVLIQKLAYGLDKFYPKGFLSAFGIGFATAKRKQNWLTHFVAKPNMALHPIRHIILIRSLGLNLNEFYQYVISHKTLGQVDCLPPP